MPDYEELRQKGTNGINCEVDTEDIVAFLQQLEARCRFTLSDIGHDRLTIHFETLPDDVATLATEIYQICPDTVEQGFGVLDEQIEMLEESGEDIPEDLRQLVEGIDLSQDDFGLKVMARSIQSTRVAKLWWD